MTCNHMYKAELDSEGFGICSNCKKRFSTEFNKIKNDALFVESVSKAIDFTKNIYLQKLKEALGPEECSKIINEAHRLLDKEKI